MMLDEARFNVYDAGSGQAVLFLHGNASRLQHWASQLHALSGRFRCVAFDFRGYGASGPLATANSLSLMADDAAALCHALGVEHTYVVGMSMGGAVAQALALRYPNLVAGLVLLGPQPIDVVPAAMSALTIDMLRPLFVASFGSDFQQRQPAETSRLVDELAETSLETLQNYSSHDLPMDPTQIEVPTLVLAGGQDVLAPPAGSRQLAERLPRGVYQEIPGAGHMVNLEAPEAITDAIVHFIKDHGHRK